MRLALLPLLACPACGRALTVVVTDEAPDGGVREGQLDCACGAGYPIRRSIPRFASASTYADSFGLQWNRFRREQLDRYNGTTQSEGRFRSETGWLPEQVRGWKVLDVGCGAGRFLEVASRDAALAVGVDVSNAVDAARANLADRPNVELVQASAYALPFVPGAFDACYCIGVVQHTPDPAATMRALAGPVRADGEIAVTVYERRRFTPLYAKYLLRPFTRRLPGPKLLRGLELVMPVLFPLTDVLFRIPLLGRVFAFVIPVANYVGCAGLDRDERYRWALMDTFDMLAPTFDSPQTESEVRAALSDGGVTDLRRLPNPGVNLVGRKAG